MGLVAMQGGQSHVGRAHYCLPSCNWFGILVQIRLKSPDKGKANVITHRIIVLEIQTHHMLKTHTPPAPPLRQSSAFFLLKIPQNPIFLFHHDSEFTS